MNDAEWIIKLDNLGPFADLEELQTLFDSIPAEEKKHPQAKWLEGFIMGRSMQE